MQQILLAIFERSKPASYTMPARMMPPLRRMRKKEYSGSGVKRSCPFREEGRVQGEELIPSPVSTTRARAIFLLLLRSMPEGGHT